MYHNTFEKVRASSQPSTAPFFLAVGLLAVSGFLNSRDPPPTNPEQPLTYLPVGYKNQLSLFNTSVNGRAVLENSSRILKATEVIVRRLVDHGVTAIFDDGDLIRELQAMLEVHRKFLQNCIKSTNQIDAQFVNENLVNLQTFSDVLCKRTQSLSPEELQKLVKSVQEGAAKVSVAAQAHLS